MFLTPDFVFNKLNNSIAEIGISVETRGNWYIYKCNGINIGYLAKYITSSGLKDNVMFHSLGLYIPKSIYKSEDKNRRIGNYYQFYDGYTIEMEDYNKIELALNERCLEYDFSQISEKMLYSIGLVKKAMLEIEKRNIEDERL